MKSKIFCLFILLLWFNGYLNAQEYLISFAGSGASTTVDSVIVENLTQGTSLGMNGNNVLHLVYTSTEIEHVNNNPDRNITFYPNPMDNYTLMKFVLPEEGNTVINMYDISGRKILQTQEYLSEGQHTCRIQGVGNGLFVVTIRSGRYSISGNVLSTASQPGTPKMFYDYATIPQEKNDISKIQAAPFNSKGMSSETFMQYTTGDRFKFTGSSGIYSTVLTYIPSSDTTITFNLIACTDADNNNYPVVFIGNQIWMAENLRTTKYKNGDLIGTTTPATLDITGESSPEYQWAYDGNESNANTYGRLYTWFAVTDSLEICPTGWHAPTDAETTTLSDYLTKNAFGYGGIGSDIAKALAATLFWTTNSTAGTIGNDQTSNNSSSFTGLPGGFRYSYGPFASMRNSSYYWLANDYNTSYAWSIAMRYNESEIEISPSDNRQGFSVRCLKDNPKNEEAYPGVEGNLVFSIVREDTIYSRLINGEYVFQGDIILTENQFQGSKGTGKMLQSTKMWPEGNVYYQISPSLPIETIEKVHLAITDYTSHSKLKFIERTNQENYVMFYNTESPGTEYFGKGTCSNLGMLGGRQFIWLEPSWNNTGEIIHEIGHTIGLVHEHSRTDRDKYIIINWDNISRNKDQYAIDPMSFHTGNFDFESIMLYYSLHSGNAKDINKPVITRISSNSGYELERVKLSSSDLLMIDSLYAPIAYFMSSKRIIFEGETILFTDTSSKYNPPTKWHWDFGDGENSTVQNPSHTYLTSGTFSVTLTASNIFDDVETKINYITVRPKPTDLDGNKYNVITLGTQVWFQENLRATKLNDGTLIPNIIDDLEWVLLDTSAYAYSWYNNDEAANKNIYGALYKWKAVETGKLCPIGWHVSTDEDWKTLENYLIANGFNYNSQWQGSIAKSIAAASGWNYSENVGNVGNNQSTNNSSGFTARPAGYRMFGGGYFEGLGIATVWWTPTIAHESEGHEPWIRQLNNLDIYLGSTFANKFLGLSVRCVKDN